MTLYDSSLKKFIMSARVTERVGALKKALNVFFGSNFQFCQKSVYDRLPIPREREMQPNLVCYGCGFCSVISRNLLIAMIFNLQLSSHILSILYQCFIWKALVDGLILDSSWVKVFATLVAYLFLNCVSVCSPRIIYKLIYHPKHKLI
jgi:hypothetical protein